MERLQVVILVYVDDLVIVGSEEDGVKRVKDKLGSLFKLVNLGEMSYHLGVLFECQENLLSLHQAAYCRRVLERPGMVKAKSAPIAILDNIENLFVGVVRSEVGKTVLRHSHTGSF